MANDLNRLCLIGRLGKDAELDTTQAGKQYMKFSLATNRKKGQEEVTEWHNITVWNEKLVEHLHPYLTKGKQIYLEGLVTSWKKEDGNTVPFVEVSYGHNIQLLGSKNDAPAQVPEEPSKGGSVLDKPAARPDDDGVPW